MFFLTNARIKIYKVFSVAMFLKKKPKCNKKSFNMKKRPSKQMTNIKTSGKGFFQTCIIYISLLKALLLSKINPRSSLLSIFFPRSIELVFNSVLREWKLSSDTG